MNAWILVATVALAACAGPREERSLQPDHDRSRSRGAIEQFVRAGRTPAAFARMASAFEEMRPARSDAGGDPSTDPVVAADAELRLLALAAPLVEPFRRRSLDAELDALALTVWPTLLSDPLTGDARPTVAPRPGESARTYVARLCSDELALHCGAVPADVQPAIVRAAALRNANERMRKALARCMHCASDGPEWQRLGWMLESLDDEAAHHVARAARAARIERVAVTQARRGR